MRAAVLCIPKGKGEGEVEPTLGGTSAGADDGADTDDAEARDGETVAPFASMLSCGMPASTHVGELWRAARRRSARACHECFPECLLRRAGVVRAMRLCSEERGCMR